MPPNVFDQFDAAPAGVAPVAPTAPSLGNVFDQFNGGEGPTAPPAAAAPTRLLDTQVFPLPTPQEAGRYVSDKVQQAAPDLYNSIYENTVLGAEQRANPTAQRYGQPLSTNLEINDAGEVSFKDAQGNSVPTDKSKHVVLKTPDGYAVYARTPDTTESPAVGTARVLSLGLGAEAPGSTAAAVARTRPSTEATIPKLREAADTVYKDPAILARPVPQADIAAAFKDPLLANRDPRILQAIRNEISDLGGKGRPITVSDLNIASERLGVLANETQGPLGSQTATPLAQAATVVKKSIDSLLTKVAPEWAAADQNYGAARQAQTIVGRGDLATVRARGGDWQEKMAQQATTLLANPKLTRGLQPEELDMLRAISEGTLPGDKRRTAAEWLVRRIAQLGPLAGGMLGYQEHGVIGAGLGFLGSVALEGAISKFIGGSGNKAAVQQVNDLVANIRARTPLAVQLQKNVQDWEQARAQLMRAPGNATLAGLAASSRELSKTLGAAGLKIRPDLLMRTESPGTSQADQNQQQVGWPVGQ